MQIDPTILSEKNYTGTRLIEINDPKVKELKDKLKKIQVEEVNPILDSTEPLLKILDPFYAKIRDLRESIKPILAKAKPLQEEYQRALENTEIPKAPESPLLTELSEKIKVLEDEYNKEYARLVPKVPKLDALAEKMKVYIDEVHVIEAQINEIKKEMQPTKEAYEKEMKKVEIIDQRAQLIKSKLVPLVQSSIEKELGEFEKALQVIDKDEKMFVEVVDEIEEKIKQARAEKLKAKSTK